jgi:hypothetical protein
MSSKIPIKSKYSWNELNRAKEAITFFEAVIQPSLERDGVSITVIESMKTSFMRDILNIISQKFAQTHAPLDVTEAVKIIDEELPKLLKESSPGVDINGILNMWSLVKKILSGGENENEQKVGGNNSTTTTTNKK